MRKIDSPERDNRMGNWLKPDEDEAFQDAVLNPTERIIVMLLRHTGLRVGEATSLLWSDIDFNAQTLTVRKSKTKAGERTIPLAPVLVPALRTWQRPVAGRRHPDFEKLKMPTKAIGGEGRFPVEPLLVECANYMPGCAWVAPTTISVAIGRSRFSHARRSTLRVRAIRSA
jgi:integrase